MNKLILAGLLVLSSASWANEPPTFIENPNPPHYSTGALKPLTAEQKKLEEDYAKRSEAEGWTFEADVRGVGKYALGLKKNFGLDAEIGESLMPIGDGESYKSISLEDFKIALPPTKDQKNCGSCVYFAVSWAFEALNWLYANPTPILSPKYLMNYSGSGWKCSGAYASGNDGVAAGLVKLGGLCSEADYPYTQPYENGRAPNNVTLHGRIAGFKTLNPSPRDALFWFNKRTPVLVTVGANGPFQSYSSGEFNACSQTPTNHEMVAIGLDCEDAVDAAGNCLLDTKGNLPPGKGIWTVQNSWGNGFGEKGRIRIKVTDKNGRKCNRIAEEMVVLDSGLPEPVSGPVDFTLSAGGGSLKVTVQPGELRADAVKASLQAAGF